MIHDVDLLAKQLRQDGYVVFQLLSPEEAAGINGLVRGIACKCSSMHCNLCFELLTSCVAAYTAQYHAQGSSFVDVGVGPAFSTE